MRRSLPGIFCLIFAALPVLTQAQKQANNSIGIQLNPYIDEHFFTGTFCRPVYALRYTFSIGDKLTLGPELSGYMVKHKTTEYRYTTFNTGGYARYSFLPQSRIRPFAEVSAAYTFYKLKVPENYYTPSGTYPPESGNEFSWYAAPGVSLWSKSRKMSLDLMYKFSDDYFINGKTSVFSYRFNFWF